MWGAFYYVPLYFLSVMQTSSVTAGVNLLPAVLVTVPGSIVSGRLVSRFNNYRLFVWVGWGFTTLSMVLLVIWRFVDVTTAVWATTLAFFGLGQGMILNAQQFATQAMCHTGDEGHAASMYLFLRQFGAAVGVGVGGTTFQNVMSLKLSWEGLPTKIASEAEGFIVELRQMADGDETKNRILDAYRYGFGGVFQLYLGIAGVALLLSLLFIKHYSLDRSLDTEHVLQGSTAAKMLVGGPKSTTDSGQTSGLTTPERFGSTTNIVAHGLSTEKNPSSRRADGVVSS